MKIEKHSSGNKFKEFNKLIFVEGFPTMMLD